MKRLVVGVFVSALTMFGVAPAASAATSHQAGQVKVHTVKKPKPPKVIDWDAPPADGGGVTVQRVIDWD